MRIRERAIVLAVIAISLVLLSAGLGVHYLWRSMVSYHSTRLSEQIHDTLYNEIAAGNFFGITAALGRLRMSGLLIDSALIRISHGTIEWLYTSTDEFRLKLDNLGVLFQYCRNGEPGTAFDTKHQLITFNRISSNPDEMICVAAETGMPLQLSRIRWIFLFVLGTVVCFCVVSMAWMLVRMSRKEVELEKLASNEKLRLTRALAEQAWQVAHDIRSPLAAINLAIRGDSKLEGDNIQVIHSAVGRINAIADDLIGKTKSTFLDLTKTGGVQHSEHQAQLEPANIGEFLRSVWLEKEMELSDRPNVQFKLDLGGLTEAICNVDRKELARALSNLVNNAVEALGPIGGNVGLALRDSMGDVAIIVSDNGSGITPELLQKLGKERVSEGKSGVSGSGLGVRHAHLTVERMAGRFNIESRVGRGTLVTIKIPRVNRTEAHFV